MKYTYCHDTTEFKVEKAYEDITYFNVYVKQNHLHQEYLIQSRLTQPELKRLIAEIQKQVV